MLGSSIAVLTTHHTTRRQIARALHSGGTEVVFIEESGAIHNVVHDRKVDLIILDADNLGATAVENAVQIIEQFENAPPVVLLSIGSNKAPLLDLIQKHEIGNLVAKHGAIRAVFPILDERELLVTCEKVLRRNIFGIEKYVGGWGVLLHRRTLTALSEKSAVLDEFEQYLTNLATPPSVILSIVTVAEELILNAVVHAPRTESGQPKHENSGILPQIKLEPHEYVDVVYGCDGQRLMLSVTDKFGSLNKKTLYNYVQRGFSEELVEVEGKPSGAGLGLAMAFRSIHQLIFNVHDTKRTEVIAGWYLRINTSIEFRRVGKSLNVFWLPANSQPVEKALDNLAQQSNPTRSI